MNDNQNLILKETIASHLGALKVGMPAKVVDYDPATRLATVKGINPVVIDDEDPVEAPEIYHVPVMFPGAGGAVLSFPIAPGDEGYVFFSDTDISGYVTGDTGVVPSQRQHALNDAVFFPCFSTKTASATHVTLSFAGSLLTMGPDGSMVLTPGSGTVFVAGSLAVTGAATVTGTATLGGAVIGGKDFGTHTHPGVQSGGNTTGAPS